MRAPLALDLVDSNGEAFSLAELQGRPTLLYLFATFDLTSQAALDPLLIVAREHPELNVIGIALQPNPQDLLQIFASALNIDIPLAYEPDNQLLRGLTEVGPVEGVPAYVLLDGAGFVLRHSVGPMNAVRLRAWCDLD